MSETMSEPFVACDRGAEKHVWLTRRLWQLAADLPVFDYQVAQFDFDEDVWFGDCHRPSVGRVLDHYRRIEAATFDHPIVLSQRGEVLDGVHRICRARLDGRLTVPAVQFNPDPVPDRVEPLSGSGGLQP